MGLRSKRSTHYGSILWTLGIQYFATQIIASLAWKGNFSLVNNPISDLGNTRCGVFAGRLVCSPLHGLMNLSFVALGLGMLGGAILIRQHFESGHIKNAGFACIGLAGIGTILVGLYPENSVAAVHIAGAAMAFVLGNLGMMLLGLRLQKVSLGWRIYTFVSGLVGGIALLLFFSGHYLWLGGGGMERLTSYPLTTWMILFGAYLLRPDFDR